MKLLSTTEAAKIKGTSRQVIIGAIERGAIDAQKIGGRYAVKANKKFEDWTPSERHQASAKSRWGK